IAPLHGIETLDRGVLPRIDREAVERIRRIRDHASLAKHVDGARQRGAFHQTSSEAGGAVAMLGCNTIKRRTPTATITSATVSSTKTARKLSVPSKPQTTGLIARPASDPVLNKPKPVPRAVGGMTAAADV